MLCVWKAWGLSSLPSSLPVASLPPPSLPLHCIGIPLEPGSCFVGPGGVGVVWGWVGGREMDTPEILPRKIEGYTVVHTDTTVYPDRLVLAGRNGRRRGPECSTIEYSYRPLPGHSCIDSFDPTSSYIDCMTISTIYRVCISSCFE